MIRAVLFDLDDTLFDHRRSARAALTEVHSVHAPDADFVAFEQHHAHYLEEMHMEVLAGRIGLDDARRERFRRVFIALGLPLAEPDVDAVATAYRRGYLSARRPVEGAADLLTAIRPHARIAVVTNNLLDEQREKLAFCGLSSLVDELVVSDDVGVSKPDPVIFHLALARLDAGAEESVMVGDSWDADIFGAAAAGIRPVWFNPGHKRRPLNPPDVAEIHALAPAGDLLPLLLDAAGPGP